MITFFYHISQFDKCKVLLPFWFDWSLLKEFATANASFFRKQSCSKVKLEKNIRKCCSKSKHVQSRNSSWTSEREREQRMGVAADWEINSHSAVESVI